MKITSIETSTGGGGDYWHGTAIDGVTRYQWFLHDSYFSIMEEERPYSEMWSTLRPPPRAMKQTVLQAIRAARH
jgi:hypothetical protein